MPYQIISKKSAEKYIEKLPKKTATKIINKILSLENEPRPEGCIKLKGGKDGFRIRIGDYRVVYLIDDENKIVRIIDIGDRKDIYK